MAGFRLRVAVQTSFDGSVKFQMCYGLPPPGIISIPITFIGKQNEPKVKMEKADNEQLSGSEDSDDEL
jgi:hypothetical protein